MLERHPCGEFIPKNPRWMIIGSFPVGKFTNPKKRSSIKSHEIDFFFGGEKNLLWKLLGDCFDVELKTKNDIKRFLERESIAIGDVIRACHRINGGAADSALCKIEWNYDLLKLIEGHHLKKVFFTSKKVEIWFRRLFPEAHGFEMITLISPSGQSVRGLSRYPGFAEWEARHRGEPKYNFILRDYRLKFRTMG